MRLTAKMSEQSEAGKEADAFPFSVTYSSSGDTVSITFELDEHHGGDEQYSLSADFVIEIVDALSDQNQEKIDQLLELSAKVGCEIEVLNKRRKRWGFHDDEIFAKVRKRCAKLEDFISVYPESHGKIRSFEVGISDEIDPFGEIRKRIKETKVVDDSDSDSEITEHFKVSLDFCDKDSYPPDEKETIEEDDQANSCYHTTQMEMANILKKRIKTIMRHYHGIEELRRAFGDVEFAVYTARYRMLSDQTEKRICHPHAGVLSREELETHNEGNVKKRMFMYVRSAETDAHFTQLKQDIQEKSRTLFIIIADECHWGITKDKDQTPSAHNLFINEWGKENSPRNVVVLQISATPFNLLTQNSRLPEVKCSLLSDNISTAHKNYEAGDLLVLESEPDLKEDIKKNSKEVELHVVHWSEVELKNLEDGVWIKLKSTLSVEDSPYPYVRVSSEGTLDVTSNEGDATDFIVQGKHGIVTIKPLVSTGQLFTMTRNEKGDLEARTNPPNPAFFEVRLDFGVGVAAFSLLGEGCLYLVVDEHGVVGLQAAGVEWRCGVAIIKPKQDVAQVSFQFYIDRCWPVKVGEVGQQYISLNYYLSTLNHENKTDQNIREDESFQKLLKKAKREEKIPRTFSADAVLCAEYCYYVLHVSAFNCANKVRQVLRGDIGESPASQFAKTLDTFIRKLEKRQDEDCRKEKKSIPPEAFKFVLKEIRQAVEKDFRDNLKQRQRYNDSMCEDDEQKMAFSLVAYVMHHSGQELKNVVEETHSTSIVQDIKDRLEENDCQKMLEIWNSLVQECETNSLVLSLIQSGQPQQFGKMKIVRAKSQETANQFYNTLKFVQTVCSLEVRFEIIKDYGGIQIKDQLVTSNPFFKRLQTDDCQAKIGCLCNDLELQPRHKKCVNCGHVHKSITQYEDLENLACLLILVDKGRMGDTFPHSFDCLDLRLSYDSKPLYLSTVIQELGRMCRYAKISVDGSRPQNLPYVLVGPELYRALKESVRISPSIMSLVSRNRTANKVDRYMSVKRRANVNRTSPLRWTDYEASKDSYDHENQQKHCNRILLQAEPQIGKTGSYLCLIKYLRLDILGKEKVLSARNECDEGTFYLLKDSDLLEEFVAIDTEDKQNWQFPYWETIQNLPSLNKKAVASGKYSIGGCFYTHDMEENPFRLMKPTRSERGYEEVKCKDDFRAFHWYHFLDCSECGLLLEGQEPVLETIEVGMDDVKVPVTCSLPFRFLQDSNLREQLKSGGFKVEGGYDHNLPTAKNSALTLPYWIFHPSHRDDPRKCLFNYHHVMQEDNRVASFMQVAVVRSERFPAYRSTWGKALAIFQLPDELPKCDCGPDEGGVGYSRLFIQKLASALNLEYVFVIDDNVAMMHEAQFNFGDHTGFSATVLRNPDGTMKMQRCSFLKPLIDLQNIAEGKVNPPEDGEEYKPHPLKKQFEAQNFPLYSYTGPAKLFSDKRHESYGVLGLLRSIPRVRHPFSKTQVYALVLLNVKSTVEKGVFYRPWPCWEDQRFNDDCDKAGLWVVKCNRYHFSKLQYQDWINSLALPYIYQWNEETKLTERPLESELPKDLEESITLAHLRKLVDTEGPGNCFKEQIENAGQENDQTDAEGVADIAGRGLSASADSPVGILEQLEIDRYVKESSGIPVLILSYDRTSTLPFKNLSLFNESYCSTRKKVVFVLSARQVQETWKQKDGMTLADVRLGSLFPIFSAEMKKKNGEVAIFSAADPGRHNLRWIVIDVSFSKQELCVESNSSRTSKKSPGEMLKTGALGNAEERTGIDQRGGKRSSEGSVEDFQVNKKVAGDEKMNVQNKKDPETSLENKASNSKRSPYYSDTATRKRPRVEDCVSDSPTTNTTDEQMDVSLVTPGPSTSILAKTQQQEIGDEPPSSGSAKLIEVGMAAVHQPGENLLGTRASLPLSETNMEASSDAVPSSSEQDKKTSSKERDFVRSPVTGLVPDDPAYDEGTSTVTDSIVKLWREKVKQKSNKDIAKEKVEKALNFEKEELEKHDGKGYNALTKACSLPSVGIRVVSHLLNERKIDVNPQIPPSFNTDDPAARWLTPGMSALSVAIRRGNVKCVSTFMKRETEIKLRSTDRDLNTALHHCVLSSDVSKTAFDRLFRCYHLLEWKEMKNNQGKNPLDVARERWRKSDIKTDEKRNQMLEYVLNEMDPGGQWKNQKGEDGSSQDTGSSET